MANTATWKKSRLNEMLGILAWSGSLLVFICLLTYDAYDPSWNVTASRELYHNSAGKFGAYVSDGLLQFFGYAAFLIPLPLLVVGYKKIRGRDVAARHNRVVGTTLLLLTTSTILEFYQPHWIRIANFSPGGTLGFFVKMEMVRYLNVTGSII